MPFGVLWAAGVPAAIVNPRAVRRFAEAMGILEKTDRIDTGVIAWFAEVKRIVPQPPASPAQQQLAPIARDNGKLAGKRPVRGGRSGSARSSSSSPPPSGDTIATLPTATAG